ncbi:MAG: response regulator [Gemmatimonadota bacterium]
MLRVLLADDHEIVRKGLIQILGKSFPGIAVDEAGDGPTALALLEKGRYALVLLDISMPGRGGLEVLKEIRSRRPETRVLILSMHPEEEYAARALRAGASGYVTKRSAAEELVTAVRKVLAGGRYVSASLAEMLAGELAPASDRPPHDALSDREYQVMRMIASGKTVTEIAEELSLSVKTISTYRTRILEKMKIRNNAGLARYAAANRLLD